MNKLLIIKAHPEANLAYMDNIIIAKETFKYNANGSVGLFCRKLIKKPKLQPYNALR